MIYISPFFSRTLSEIIRTHEESVDNRHTASNRPQLNLRQLQRQRRELLQEQLEQQRQAMPMPTTEADLDGLSEQQLRK